MAMLNDTVKPKLIFLQRNYSTSREGDRYVTIPERLKDFQTRVNVYLNDGYFLQEMLDDSVNGVHVHIAVLVLEEK